MTGNVLIKNRTPSSDVPYLFGLPKQKTTLLRRTSVLRSKTLPQGEFISPEDVQSKGFPQGLQPLWENDLPWLKGSPKSQRLLGERKGSGVSELWLLSLSEGYGTCLDERDDGEISEILISCRAGNWPFLRCCGVPASRSA